jgi:hypothetical protein
MKKQAIKGAKDAACLAAFEKWLSDEWRDNSEIEAAATDYVAGRKVCGAAFTPQAFNGGLAILKAELKRRRALAAGEAVHRVGDTVPFQEAPTAPAISGGWKHGKLILKAVPNGNKPGVFTFGRKEYTVPSGKAWACVCSLIEAGGFNSHGVEMDSPSAMFKREHRAFFTERMASDATGWWYIKTV